MTQPLFLFGELKSEHSSNNKLLVTDLYRLAISMKEEIDIKNLQMAIGFFRLLAQVSSSTVWSCLPVASTSLLGCSKLCFCCSTLLVILSQIYSNKCVESNLNMQSYQCPTLPNEMLDEMLMKCKSKQNKDDVVYRR
ncbi:hypothetical protein PS15p_210031 [Mucor circinelloides]